MRIHRAWLLTLGLLVSLALLAACAVPLAPGYHLRREALTVRYQPEGSSPLRVRIDAELQNVGNAQLDQLTLRMPRSLLPGTNPAVSINGRPVAAVMATGEGGSRLQVPIDPPLARRGSLAFRLNYEIQAASPGFALDPETWFASFIRPKHLFAKGEARAGKTQVELSVPAGYSALTTGRRRGVRLARSVGETEYRFEIREDDFPPFLVAGKFNERKIRTLRRDVIFWTLQPLDGDCAQAFAGRLATTANLYRSHFGRLSKHAPPIQVIEIPAGNGSPAWQDGGFGSIPQGILFSVAPSELCRDPQRFFPAAERALAATWFGWAVRPEPDARAFLAAGVRRYAMLLAEEGGSPAAARERLVKAWIEEYDGLRSGAKPIAPSAMKVDSPVAERKMAGIQSALFLIALQDRFGPVAVRHALAHLVSSLRDSTAGLDDVRSALEEATGHNLFGLFTLWLYRPGIPAAFRRQYLAAKTIPAHQKKSTLNSRRAR